MTNRASGVSIGIVFHNEQDRILGCLSALLSAYRFYQHESSTLPVELIFVDNNSTDLSTQVVKEFCRKNELPFSLYSSETNNMARARNKVLELSKHKYLLFLDADCCPQKNWISAYLDAVGELEGQRWAAIGGENFPPLDEGKAFYHCQRLLKKNPLLFLKSTQLLSPQENRNVLHAPTCNILYRAEVLEDLGGFHESFHRVGEDLQLSARLIQSGWKIIFIPGVGVEHFDRTEFKSWFFKSFRYGSVQPSVLFSYPKSTSRLRWTPFLIIIFGLSFLIFDPKLAGLSALTMSLAVPILISLWNQNLKNMIPWIIFLNGTITFYCLGYVFGFCKTVLQALRLQSATPTNEAD